MCASSAEHKRYCTMNVCGVLVKTHLCKGHLQAVLIAMKELRRHAHRCFYTASIAGNRREGVEVHQHWPEERASLEKMSTRCVAIFSCDEAVHVMCEGRQKQHKQATREQQKTRISTTQCKIASALLCVRGVQGSLACTCLHSLSSAELNATPQSDCSAQASSAHQQAHVDTAR
jgi:hypothetical protein